MTEYQQPRPYQPETATQAFVDDQTAMEQTGEIPRITDDLLTDGVVIDERSAVERSIDYEARLPQDRLAADNLMEGCRIVNTQIDNERASFMEADAQDTSYVTALQKFRELFDQRHDDLLTNQRSTIEFMAALTSATGWAVEAQSTAHKAYQMATSAGIRLQELGTQAPGFERHLDSRRAACQNIHNNIKNMIKTLEALQTNPDAVDLITEQQATIDNQRHYLQDEESERALAETRFNETTSELEQIMQDYDNAMQQMHAIGSDFVRHSAEHLQKLQYEQRRHREVMEIKRAAMAQLLTHAAATLAINQNPVHSQPAIPDEPTGTIEQAPTTPDKQPDAEQKPLEDDTAANVSPQQAYPPTHVRAQYPGKLATIFTGRSLQRD